MSEQFQHHDSIPAASAEQDVAAVIKKIQQQLASLEKKIDILINQSLGKPSGERHFSKPFRSFGRPHRSFDGGHGNTSGGKSFDGERHFEKRHGGENRGFDPTKKPFYHKRKERG